MNEREKTIRLWFDMWLNQQDMGIDDIFTEDVIYTESWSPQYNNRKTVKHWFQEWNTRGKVVIWEIRQFFHKDNQTIVEWYFKNEMNNGDIEEFDGVSLVEWTEDNKIKALKELGLLDQSVVFDKIGWESILELSPSRFYMDRLLPNDCFYLYCKECRASGSSQVLSCLP